MNVSRNLCESAEVKEQTGGLDTAEQLTICFEDAGQRDELLRQWLELERSLPHVHLTCSADWTRTWLDVYGELTSKYFFAVGRVNGQLRAIMLICQFPHLGSGPSPDPEAQADRDSPEGPPATSHEATPPFVYSKGQLLGISRRQ